MSQHEVFSFHNLIYSVFLSFELMIVLHSLAVRSVMLEEQEEENGMEASKLWGVLFFFFFSSSFLGGGEGGWGGMSVEPQ